MGCRSLGFVGMTTSWRAGAGEMTEAGIPDFVRNDNSEERRGECRWVLWRGSARFRSGAAAGATLRMYGKEIHYEFLKLWRMKSFSAAVIGFPVMFYALFGLVNRGNFMARDGA